jgi:hypothetical protein
VHLALPKRLDSVVELIRKEADSSYLRHPRNPWLKLFGIEIGHFGLLCGAKAEVDG